jgi:hypothetical protein
MKHETKKLVAQDIKQVKAIITKVRKLTKKQAKTMQNRPKDSSIMQGLNKTYNPHILTSSQRVLFQSQHKN